MQGDRAQPLSSVVLQSSGSYAHAGANEGQDATLLFENGSETLTVSLTNSVQHKLLATTSLPDATLRDLLETTHGPLLSEMTPVQGSGRLNQGRL